VKKIKFVRTLINIWSIEELRNKILFTLMMIAIYRVGAHIALPGINPAEMQNSNASSTGMLSLIDAFSGGAFSQASIFALGIMPYISASIFMQLMTVLVPRFQKMQKEGDSGRKKITQYTRYLTVGVTLLQASACYLPQRNDGTDRWHDRQLSAILFLAYISDHLNCRNFICNVDGRKNY
jgi:preprotein translocase subunit SecY